MLGDSTTEWIELIDHESHIAVIFAGGHETETAAGLEDDHAYHQGFDEIEGADLRIVKGLRHLRLPFWGGDHPRSMAPEVSEDGRGHLAGEAVEATRLGVVDPNG
jgi:hypothetical protein